ncbi:HNH endonuclease [Methanohalobium evestigatum Z-7303]|uniref:HNH endonuclease n=1 Tax=Methanohalobium evestigatum (strain ATCC BAA-1072 / DSM 3721 / NBRC 107634 / OCM 161 / Z-7303) TaxID=644295 RepID=D7E737_METEZ|nr:RNA-guided endonuclease IscB [Methanohalobium evestigatum]ADI73661.1 HNH endonuclease [Methanohalobium evestigatum Z-7303]
MRVFVLSKNKKPLMPTRPAKARRLLESGKAKVVRRSPFTIKLLYDTAEYTQPVIAGMDSGSKHIGCAAVANDEVLYQSEVELRDDVSKKVQQRASYRRNRRSRKTRYRKPRFNNRGNSKKDGRIAPSIKSKVQSHERERRFVESILPVKKWIVETASFDIHKITNPNVSGTDYQNGDLKGYYNIRTYVLHRDNYTCQKCKNRSKDPKLECHHIVFRSKGGTNRPDNLITLCETCHGKLHNGKFTINKKPSNTKHPTEIGIVRSQIRKLNWKFQETFGYITKYKREQILGLEKTHYNDAVAICCDENNPNLQLSNVVYYKKHVSSGDYQQTKGIRSDKKIPTGKLHGLRKFDFIKTPDVSGFVKGKRTSGNFSIMDIFGNTFKKNPNVKKNCRRISARCTTLTQQIQI